MTTFFLLSRHPRLRAGVRIPAQNGESMKEAYHSLNFKIITVETPLKNGADTILF